MTRIRARTRKERDVYAGRMVRIFRRLAGISRDDMAKKLDLSRNEYICIEYGKRSLDISDVVKVCELFGIGRADFAEHMMFDLNGAAVQYEKGKGYEPEKQRAQTMAKELTPYGCVPIFQAELFRLGKRYGLIQEFRERGILQ